MNPGAISKPALLLLLLVVTSLGGCTEEPRPISDSSQMYRYQNDSDHVITYNAHHAPGYPTDWDGHTENLKPSQFLLSGAGCGRVNEPQPDELGVRMVVRRPNSTYPTNDYDHPDIYLHANWTGLECGRRYWFTYRGPGNADLYEVYDLGDGLNKKNIYKKIERVPV